MHSPVHLTEDVRNQIYCSCSCKRKYELYSSTNLSTLYVVVAEFFVGNLYHIYQHLRTQIRLLDMQDSSTLIKILLVLFFKLLSGIITQICLSLLSF